MRYTTKREQKNAYNNWKCNSCGSIFRTRRLLEQHRKVYHCICDQSQGQLNTKKTYCCKFCGKEWVTTKSGHGFHEKYCKSNPNADHYIGHSFSEESRKKISEGMKQAFKEGRATGWHKRKTGTQSYPEKWFENVIKNEFSDKNYESEFHIGKYRLDFAWPEKMRYIEIDGSQHELEERSKSDLIKDEFCKSLSWSCLRLKWQYICQNSKEAIELAKNFIDNGYISKIKWIDKKQAHKEKLESLRKEGRVDCNGNPTSSCLALEVWEERKWLILNSNVDLCKFGWLTKVMKATGLTKKVIYDTVSKFNLKTYEKKSHV